MLRRQLASLVVIISCALSADVPGADLTEASLDPVLSALRSEFEGNNDDRRRLLKNALTLNPADVTARWHSGHVVSDDGGWYAFEDVVQHADPLLSTYHDKRIAMGETAEDLLRLADWCREHELHERERAHLLQVLRLDRDNVRARWQLGHVRIEGLWISPESVIAAGARQVAIEESLTEWSPAIESALRQMRGTPFEQKQGLQALADIRSPSAIAAMEHRLPTGDEAAGRMLVEWLSRLDTFEASQALARTAIRSPHKAVQHAAADVLKERSFDHFAPVLLTAMRSPVRMQMQAGINDEGWYTMELLFDAEAQGERRQLHTTTLVGRQKVNRQGAGPKLRADLGDHARAQRFLLDSQRQLDQSRVDWNDRIRKTNNRAELVLRTVTGQNDLQGPDDWWDWWTSHNELYIVGSKPLMRVIKDPERVYVEDRGKKLSRSPVSDQVAGGALGCSCFAAGTPVWTEQGAMPIEQIEIGDRVLSQDVNTGELAYKVVQQTTVRPPVQTYRIATDTVTFLGSGGHPLWVNGSRWQFARDIEPGMQLHGTRGSTSVLDTGTGKVVEAYNLVVADFHTYFLGEGEVLCHDNSPRQPTNALVPGLEPAPSSAGP